MLPEPRGTFETVGEKVCQELVHIQFAKSVKGAYELTADGRDVLSLLDSGQHQELRRTMAKAHLQTYDNLRVVVQKHLHLDGVWRPIVEADKANDSDYITRLLEPTFGQGASEQAEQVLSTLNGNSHKKLEDELSHRVLRKAIPEMRMGVPMFRAMCDRLVSLRLLNLMRDDRGGCEFLKTYTPCMVTPPKNDWYVSLDICLGAGEPFTIYFCEPDMGDTKTREELIKAIDKALATLTAMAGYYNLPEVRDRVCEFLKIPEAAFDDGLNLLLDQNPSPFTVGLQYEGITGRRKPLVRHRDSTSIYNLIRRT